MTLPQARRPAAPYRPDPTHAGETAPPSRGTPSIRVLALPAVLAVAIAAFALLTRLAVLDRTFLGAAGVLLAWCAALAASAMRDGRALAIDVVVRTPHWLQACAQATIIAWWAAHTPLVRAFLPFVVAQLLFAYAFDALLAWSRRDRWALGFGPLPVVFSINLFLLFRPETFYWQFAMIALGFAAKEFIRWQREGRSAHIFNPSSFPLSVFSVVLLLTGTTGITFGPAIANTLFDTPHMYLVIFLVALPAQLLFGVGRMTLAAVVTTYLISLGYLAATGTYLFYDAHIPASVFLGMNLLFNDPATSPRTELGRLAFGVLYAIANVVLYVILEAHGAPTFYDKLLPVPLLNLSVLAIDRLARSPSLARLDPARLVARFTPLRANAIMMSVWIAVFVALSAVQGVGDRHPGQYLPFWHSACASGSTRACTYAAQLTEVYCRKGSGWACNEVGILDRRLGRPAESEFRRACDLGFAAGCANLARRAQDPAELASDRPHLPDLPIVLAGTKPTLRERDPARLYALACEERWPGACEGWSATP